MTARETKSVGASLALTDQIDALWMDACVFTDSIDRPPDGVLTIQRVGRIGRRDSGFDGDKVSQAHSLHDAAQIKWSGSLARQPDQQWVGVTLFIGQWHEDLIVAHW